MLYNIYIYMPENLYPQVSTAPSMSQESFNIEMVRKYYQDIANLKEKCNEKQRKYKNTYNGLLHASTGASTVGVISGVSTYRNRVHRCRLTNKCVIRRCEHRFNLCGCMLAVNI